MDTFIIYGTRNGRTPKTRTTFRLTLSVADNVQGRPDDNYLAGLAVTEARAACLPRGTRLHVAISNKIMSGGTTTNTYTLIDLFSPVRT